MSWASRAAANLLPLSRERRDLAQALKEWRYAGNYHDLETPSADCELCDHPNIRYQFEIQNLFTDEALLIGSECINRFGIAATDEEGRTLGVVTRREMRSRKLPHRCTYVLVFNRAGELFIHLRTPTKDVRSSAAG